MRLLRDLTGRGLAVRPDGERLRLRPRSALTDADREAVLALERELVRLLNGTSLLPFRGERN